MRLSPTSASFRTRISLLLAALTAAGFSTPVVADEAELPATATEIEEVDLPVVITTATRVESELQHAPGNVSVVTQKDIDKTPRAGLKELVRNLEGVVTGQLRGQSDLTPGIDIRGVSGQARTMVMIDGIPMNTSYSGQIQAVGGLDTDDVRQVEVVRGPYSSLYGSSAIGGVVNFITIMPEESEYRASIGYGDAFEEGRAQKNLVKGYVSATHKASDALRFKLSYGWLDSDGYKSDLVTTTTAPTGVSGYSTTPTSTGGTQYIVGNKGYGAVEKSDLTARAVLKADLHDTFDVTYMHSTINNRYQSPETYLVDGSGATVYSDGAKINEASFLSNINDITNDIYAVDWQHRFADSRLDVKYSNLQVDEWYSQAGRTTGLAGGAGTLTPRYSENAVLDVVWQAPIGNSMLLVGGQYKKTDSTADTYNMTDWTVSQSKTDMTTSSGGKERVAALFVDWQTDVTDRVAATVGGRYERWTGYDGYTADYTHPTDTTLNQRYGAQTKNNFSPKATVAFRVADATTLKASWGRAFRAPDALNLYRNYLRGTTQYLANPDLKPEVSESFEMGAERTNRSRGLFKAYVFQTTITDMISTRDANTAGTIKERINIGKARSRGLELSAVQPFGHGLRGSANYTLLQTRVLENEADPESVGKRLTSVPKHMLNLGLTYDAAQIYGAINYEYMSRRYFNSSNNDINTGVYGAYDAYSLVNAKIGYRINASVEASLAVSNLLDKTFYNSVLTEGRAWFVQMKVKL